mgnify:CR=1 FL=1
MLKIDLFRFLRFMPVGMVAGIIDGLVAGAVFLYFGRSAAIPAMLGGIVIGYPISFFGHRHVTYGTGMTSLLAQIGGFALYKSPNVIIRYLVALAILAEFDWGILGLAVIILWSFIATRWIFTGTPPWQKAA